MTTISVLVAVNVSKALDAQNLSPYIYMVDSTGYNQSGQGGNELITNCNNGDTLIWTVAPIDPNSLVSIHAFSGQAISSGMINPAAYPQSGNMTWGGRVNSAGNNVQYTMSLLLERATILSFDPFITATNVQSIANVEEATEILSRALAKAFHVPA